MGALKAVATSGNRLYAGLGPRVIVVDAADPGQPTVVGATPLPGAFRVVAAGQLVGVLAPGGTPPATALERHRSRWYPRRPPAGRRGTEAALRTPMAGIHGKAATCGGGT